MSVTVVDAGKVSEYKLEITHLVTVGCSWTYCQGLENITRDGWPALVAKDLNIPVVNLGTPGIGNDNIHRRTYEYFYQNLPTKSNPLFIIAWTQPWRREAWFEAHGTAPVRKFFNEYGIINMPEDKPQNHYEHALLENWSEEDFHRKTLLYKLSLINLFRANNVPYLMTDFSSHYPPPKQVQEKIKKHYSVLWETMMNDSQKIKEFHELTTGIPKTPCLHENEEGNRIVADYATSEIRNRFDDYKFVNNKEYLKLSEFIKGQKYSGIFPEWCEIE